MNPPLPDEFIDLLEALAEDNLDEDGRARLVELLRERSDLVPLVAEHLRIARAVSEAFRPDEDFSRRTAIHVARLGDEDEGAFARGVTRRIVRRRAVATLATAAVLTLAALPLLRHRGGERPAALASVAEWVRLDDDQRVVSRDPVPAGRRLEGDQGLSRLEFANGAVVALQAPFALEVVSVEEILLHSGRLNAWCPDSAHGFEVRTSSASAIDLGTSFGVEASADGRSEFIVLDGRIKVAKGTHAEYLTGGTAMRTSADEPLQLVDFDPSDFQSTWALAHGILATRGALVPARPTVPAKLVELEDDHHLLVIPERQEVPFNRKLLADMVGAGTYPDTLPAATARELEPIPGKRLTSILIRYNPVGSFEEEEFLRFEGEVTFDRPVLAIQARGATLEHGDPVFATWEWPSTYRGVETWHRVQPPDSVTLSEDRRTVKVVFYTGRATDDLRVILEDN